MKAGARGWVVLGALLALAFLLGFIAATGPRLFWWRMVRFATPLGKNWRLAAQGFASVEAASLKDRVPEARLTFSVGDK